MGKAKSKQTSEALLWPLFDKATDLRREYRKRNSKFEQRRAKADELNDFLEQGWLFHRKLKGSYVIRKDRPVSERLKNLWWVLLYKMGYSELNSGHQFRILLKGRGKEPSEKNVDVFASDDETVVVTECIALDRLKKKSLRDVIEDFSARKGEIANSIKLFYGKDYKPKILWFIVTENVVWSEEDVARAEVAKIRRVTENELPYYTQLADHLGKAARFQFLAEFLKDQAIPELSDTKVPATRGKLGGRYFYSFVITPRHLLKISFVNHRTLDDPEGHPTYQRLIQKNRLKAIGKYIQDGGTFPNNLLINFAKSPRFDILQKDTVADVHFGSLYLPNTYKSAWIIDGQHRLYGYAGLGDEFLDQKLVVVAFEGISKEQEAAMFVSINHEQKSVPKNLLDDLEGQLKWGSDNPAERIGALAARLIHKMNRDLSSPLYGRFSAEGIKGTPKVCLTVPQIKLGLRRSGLLGSVIQKNQYEPGVLCGRTDNASLVRAHKVLNSYFRLVADTALAKWELGRPGKLCTNESIQALTLLLAEIINYIEHRDGASFRTEGEVSLMQAVSELFGPVLDGIMGDQADALLSVQFGSGGPRELFHRLAKLIREAEPKFKPAGYDDWEKSQSQELRRTADEQIQQISILVQKHIFTVFRRMYGEDRNAYWEKGVSIKDVKAKAYTKSLEEDSDSRLPLETYLDFIELKRVAELKENWLLFKSVLDIPEPGVKGQAKNLDWMVRINELRRIPAHAAEQRNYKPTDFSFIDSIATTLQERVNSFDYDSVGGRDE
ncbi:DGQHR domain-containing protein [Lysobacter sp. Hz 25]|uniref:DGQHR domain-containing protein n=1 Tax=Lysobacter sp. Hz 25 TaxID=3383698 RepID=UPI0038D4F5AA